MQMPIEYLSKKILSRQIDKQDAMRLFQSLDKESQAQVLAIFRRTEIAGQAADTKGMARPLRAIGQHDLADEHRAWIASLVEKYERLTPSSRPGVPEHPARRVDARGAVDLIRDLKPLQFRMPHVRAEGASVHDADGNRYIDISSNMGVNLFGHRAPFLIDAFKQDLEDGGALTGDSAKIFRACELFCGATGHDRALFTQSSADAAVLAAGIARAATGRRKIVVFGRNRRGLSGEAAATRDRPGRHLLQIGTMQAFSDQAVVLDYAESTSLDTIEQIAGEIAAVVVDPVQLRHSREASIEFIKALRQLTIEKRIPLVFDESITGFRICPKGAQGYLGVQADMAIYGAIPGGGLPMGVIAGAARYMDLIDCGTSRFDDDSLPNANRLDIVGTIIQHPMAISAVPAVLGEIAAGCGDGGQTCDNCSCFQRALNNRVAHLAGTLNAFFAEAQLPVVIDTFGSLFRFRFVDCDWSVSQALFFVLLRMEGVETSIDGDCFLTTAHGDADIEAVISAVKSSMATLMQNGFFIEAALSPIGDAAVSPEPQAAPPRQPADRAPPRNEIERLRALLTADLALAEESGNSR